jgi:hypothetical protein
VADVVGRELGPQGMDVGAVLSAHEGAHPTALVASASTAIASVAQRQNLTNPLPPKVVSLYSAQFQPVRWAKMDDRFFESAKREVHFPKLEICFLKLRSFDKEVQNRN